MQYTTLIRNTENSEHKIQKYRVFDDGSGLPWTDGVEQTIVLAQDYCGKIIPRGSTSAHSTNDQDVWGDRRRR